MMIVQVHKLASKRPSMTIFTTMSAWRKSASGEIAAVPVVTVKPLSTSRSASCCGPVGLDPMRGLAPGPALRRYERDRQAAFGKHLLIAHDSLMNDTIRRSYLVERA